MRTSPEAVTLVLKGWLGKSTPLFCTVSCFGVSVSSQCRVSKVGEDFSFVLESEDGKTSISVGFDDEETGLIYAEPRAFSDSNPEGYASLPESQKTASALSIAFPLRVKLSARDDVPTATEKVFLMELAE
jgi:hypothetical protein